MTRALVIGDSHTNAISLASAAHAPGHNKVVVHRLASRSDVIAHQSTFKHAIKLLNESSPDSSVFLSVIGTYHNIIGLMQPAPLYDFMLEQGDIPAKGTMVQRLPHRVIAGVFEDHFAKAATLRLLRDATRSTVYVLSPPPPKQSNEFMTQKFMSKQRGAGPRGPAMRPQIASPALRVKLWQLEAKLLARWAKAEGMKFFPAPSKAFNEDGFLSRKYYFDDATHANEQYGALVLEQISECIAQQAIVEAVHG